MNIEHPACGTVRPLLSAYLDEELTAETHGRVAAHLTGCAACREELDQVSRGVTLARMMPCVQPPPNLAAQILARLSRTSQDLPGGWPLRRPLVAAGTAVLLILAAVGLWQHGAVRETPQRAVHATGVSGALDLERLASELASPAQFDRFADRYELREVNVEHALAQASFRVLCPVELGHGHTSETELRDCPLVHSGYLRGEHRIVIFQQPAGHPLIYGRTPVEVVTIAGQPCDRLQTADAEILKWEQRGTRWILVSAPGNPELKKVAAGLIAATRSS
jgi:anti-sigma factor RsiW